MEDKMKQHTAPLIRTHWLSDIEPYERPQTETLADIRDNIRLKKLLKRAVEGDAAPQSLIDSIRAAIRA
jgi:hypothetical protein